MKKGALKAGIIISFILGILEILITLLVASVQTVTGSVISVLIFFGVPGVLLLVLSLFLFRKYKKNYPTTQEDIEKRRAEKIKKAEEKQRQKEEKEKEKAAKEYSERIKQKEKERIEQELERARKSVLVNIKHIAGLPLSEGALCDMKLKEPEIIISGGGNRFHLELAKVTDISIKTDTEIQSSYVSSIGGAIAGGMLFGNIGAAIGGRAKEKKTATLTHYIIITYIKNDNIEYIGFEIDENSVNEALEWASIARAGENISSGKEVIL